MNKEMKTNSFISSITL